MARQPDFALGDATIHPAIAEAAVGGEQIRVQPRVTQVLFALARAVRGHNAMARFPAELP